MNDVEALYVDGYNTGQRRMAAMIADDLDEMSDDDGSLSGGDCVDYIYQLLEKLGVVDTCVNCGIASPIGPCRYCLSDEPDLIKIETPDEMPSITIDGDDLVGTREDMLRLARTIHDTIEGADHDRDSSR